MRRIATVALATGITLAGLGAAASTADAATVCKHPKWATKGGFGTIQACGSYTKTKSKVTVSTYLTDTKNDGYAAGIQFAFTEGKKIYTTPVHYIAYSSGKPYHGPYTLHLKPISSYNTGHLFVRECVVKVSTRKITCKKTPQKIY
jgi:hypothetical protein